MKQRHKMSKVRLLHLLDVKANSVEIASLCVPPKCSKASIEDMMGSVMDVKTAPKDLCESIAASATGGILFWGPNHRYVVMPPFPVVEQRFANTCEIEPLHSLLHKEFLFALVLVRLGEYGIGVCRWSPFRLPFRPPSGSLL